MEEIKLTAGQFWLVVAVFIPTLVYLWNHLGTVELTIREPDPEKGTDRKLTNPNYGAYIQAQGRYYN